MDNKKIFKITIKKRKVLYHKKASEGTIKASSVITREQNSTIWGFFCENVEKNRDPLQERHDHMSLLCFYVIFCEHRNTLNCELLHR